MLLTGSGDELCGLLTDPFQTLAYHMPIFGPSAFQAFVYRKFAQRSATCHSPLPWCAYSTPPPLLHVCFQFLVQFIVQFFGVFFVRLQDGRSICPQGYVDLSQGWLWEYRVNTRCSPVGLPDVSQVGLEPASGIMGVFLLS
jgi:hypothetical protein